MDLHLPEAAAPARADVLLANILAGPLRELAAHFADCLEPGGSLVISGILKGQQAELLTHYAQWFGDLRVVERDEWVRISASRN